MTGLHPDQVALPARDQRPAAVAEIAARLGDFVEFMHLCTDQRYSVDARNTTSLERNECPGASGDAIFGGHGCRFTPIGLGVNWPPRR